MQGKDALKSGELIIYGGSKGGVELRADVKKDTVWARQDQIARLFEIDRTVVTKHIRNILKDEEIDEKSNVQKMHIANSDKLVTFYSLDLILAVGYRTNSAKAISFRQWATSVLREYLIKGFNIDSTKITKESLEFDDLKDAVAFIESKKYGRVKGKLTLKLTKELL